MSRRTVPAAPPDGDTPTRHPATGVAVGLAVVLLAVVVGLVAERAADAGGAGSAAAGVTPTGDTTRVEVTADGMRFHPERITVPTGDRLVIELTNRDARRHDLVLATGAATGVVGRDETVTLDVGVVGATVAGWCSLPGHRQAGMTLTVTTTGGPAAADDRPGDPTGHHGGHHAAPAGDGTGDVDGRYGGPPIDPLATPEPGFTARDATAPPAPDGPAGRVHRRELRVEEVVREVAPGVRKRLWTFGGTAPGPVLRGQVGDTFEITLVNDGSIDHGVDFHAGALAPDGPMRPVDPGQRLVYRFTATRAGVWMYHCSTEPMLHHVGNGMYGAVIIDPPDLPAADREYVLVQSELYPGPAGEPADLAAMRAEQPAATVFNGYVSQYAHRPLPAEAGERVRVWLLNAGPSRDSAFHVVGAQFDTVYREGSWRLRPDDPGGAQVLDLSPAAGGFVETVFPEPGHYPFLSHALVDAERGARGVFEIR